MLLKLHFGWVIIPLLSLLLALSVYNFIAARANNSTPTSTGDSNPTESPTGAQNPVSISSTIPAPILRASFPDIMSGVTSAVVVVHTDAGEGSGFIFDQDGLVLTSKHVVGNVTTVNIVLDGGLSLIGRVILKDESLDIAVIQVDVAGDLPTLTFGDSDQLEQGEDVVAIGYPLWSGPGQAPTITKGVVSARRRLDGFEFIQTDSPINPGNSGGPLINNDSQVVGIITAKVEQAGGKQIEGMGLAIPINSVIDALAALPSETDPGDTPVTAPIAAPTSGWQTYRNNEHNYAIDVPPGWIVDQTNKSNLVIESPGRSAFLEVTSVVNNPGLGLGELTAQLSEFLSSEPTTLFELISHSKVTLDSGLTATRVTYRWQVAPEDCVELMTVVLVVVGSQALALSGEVCEHSSGLYRGDLEAMQNSLSIDDARP